MGSLEEEVKSGSPERVGEVHWGASLARLSCLPFVEPSWGLLNLILFCPRGCENFFLLPPLYKFVH